MVTQESTRDFDLPDTGEDETERGPGSLVIGGQSLVLVFWRMLLTVMFYNWNEEHKKKPKAITPRPSADENEVPAVPVIE